jgi:hypothetical protein
MHIAVNEWFEKTTVFLHDPFTARAPSQPTSLRFKILVRKNNVRDIRSEMSKAHRSHGMWVQPDVCGLFSKMVGSFSANVGSWPNGIKLASGLLLYQLLTQCLPRFDHEREALRSPLLDARLHSMRADGDDNQHP